MTELRTEIPRSAGPEVPAALRSRLRGAGLAGGATAASILIFVGLWWALSAAAGKEFPTPVSTLRVLIELLRNPFYDQGPNDKGIGLQLAGSLARVFTGFILGSIIAVPVGAVMGSSPLWNRMIYPIVQVLRPVSPLAWFPLGLATLKSAEKATVFAIVITSLWPTLINTAFGVGSVPAEYLQVAQVFRFSRWRYFSKVLLPYSLPHIITGLRLSMGVAWMVIVAGEMLSGGTGIGFFVWDSWNALNLDRVVSAILLIGVVGLVLDCGFELLLRRASYAG
jgi:nitrate/nitrite transport system permease protein